MHRNTGFAVACGLIGSVLPLAISSASAAETRAAGPGVCAGVRGCHVVARADVNGDGSRDAVGIARRGGNGSPHGAVLVRVKTEASAILATRWPTSYWYGPVFQGATGLDGRSGEEIVIARTSGAHTSLYRVVAWRNGSLVTLDAPGRGRSWIVDSAYTISFGWQRRAGEPVGTIRRRVALRDADPDARFTGRVATYRWSAGRWDKVASKKIYPLSDRRAYSWGGFHIPGLPRW